MTEKQKPNESGLSARSAIMGGILLAACCLGGVFAVALLSMV